MCFFYVGNLDVQYMMAISQGPTSYFIYESGDISGDPWVDGLIAIKNTPSSQRPTVVSISYGGYEAFTSASILNQFNTVAMKLGVIGITIFVSSGDDGVSGYESRPTNKGVSWCSEDSSTTSINSATYNTWSGLNTWTGQGYFAQYPASSPYVVTVSVLIPVVLNKFTEMTVFTNYHWLHRLEAQCSKMVSTLVLR